MAVRRLTAAPEPLRVLATASRTCSSASAPADIWEAQGSSASSLLPYLEARFAEGHTSPLEHITFVFAVHDISRACLGQTQRPLTPRGNGNPENFIRH